MSAGPGLEPLVDQMISVITNDGRNIVGILKGFDQATNIILDESHERVFSTKEGVQQIVLGLYIIRGDNMYAICEENSGIDYEVLGISQIREPITNTPPITAVKDRPLTLQPRKLEVAKEDADARQLLVSAHEEQLAQAREEAEKNQNDLLDANQKLKDDLIAQSTELEAQKTELQNAQELLKTRVYTEAEYAEGFENGWKTARRLALYAAPDLNWDQVEAWSMDPDNPRIKEASQAEIDFLVRQAEAEAKEAAGPASSLAAAAKYRALAWKSLADNSPYFFMSYPFHLAFLQRFFQVLSTSAWSSVCEYLVIDSDNSDGCHHYIFH
uniref:Sm domain-containing protein n=1 Tax=Chenopodium quinoa TaxID=63459 RepID=A0A803LIM3_CHEQI